jgi:hypothetical protein
MERALVLCQEKVIDSWATSLQWTLGNAYALAGMPSKGIPLLDRAVQKSAADKKLCSQSLRIGWLAEAELIAGNALRAETLSGEGLVLAKRYGERGIQAHLHRILGDIASATSNGDPSAALSQYRQALAIAEELSMRPLEARCHYAIGELLAARNGEQAGHHHKEMATRLFTAMGIAPLLPCRMLVAGAASQGPVALLR